MANLRKHARNKPCKVRIHGVCDGGGAGIPEYHAMAEDRIAAAYAQGRLFA